jgi:hypothetical protein
MLFPVLDSLRNRISNDAGGPALAVVGIAVLVFAAVGIVGLIVAAVIVIKWLNKHKNKDA